MKIMWLARLVVLTLCAGALPAQAAFVLPGNAMKCTRSATLVNCTDRFGNHFGIVQQGSDTLMRGFDVISGQYWGQASTRYGRQQLLSGVTRSGEAWFGFSQRIGWNVISRVSSSEGSRGRVTCNRLIGCN
jgi:hypothetical protein